MIRLESVSYTYPAGARIFERFNWLAETGSAWAVLGPSGCGKTTLLYLLSGLLQPESGQISVMGAPLVRPRPQTGLVLQDYGLLPWATVLDNITLGQRIRGFYGPDGRHAPAQPVSGPDARLWLHRLGLDGQEAKYPARLSGGQRQRVAIARTLVLQPDVLLMDEPFSSLDAPSRLDLEELTLQLWLEQRFTFVVVTHAIEEAAFLGQKVLVLGQAPHSGCQVLENPVFGQAGCRESQGYRDLCRDLRLCLEGDAPRGGVLKRWNALYALLALLAAWQVLALLVQQPILPGPVEVLITFWLETTRGTLLLHFGASLWRVLASMLVSVALAAPAGLVLGQSPRWNQIVSPLIYWLYPIPKVVLVPVVLLFLGIGDAAKIVIIFLILFFQILVLVRDAAAGLRPELIQSVRSLGAGRRALFRFVYLPASLPAILTALRQSVGTAVAVLYVAELFATQYGLGYYIFLNGSTLLNYPAMYAGILAMSVMGFGLYFGIDGLERMLCPWLKNR